jgi:hypothetical protein
MIALTLAMYVTVYLALIVAYVGVVKYMAEKPVDEGAGLDARADRMSSAAQWLPVVIFLGLMGLAMLIYVVLDGYDLGVGLLLHRASDARRTP